MQSSPAMTEAPRKKRRWVRWVIAMQLLFGLGVYLARDPIATKLAARALSKRGTECEGLALHVGWTLQSASVDTVTCRRAEGRFSELAFPEGATLELSGVSPRRLHAPAIRVELRESPDTLEDAGLVLFDEELARPPLLNVMTALSNFAARPDRIDLALDHVEVGREGRALVATDVRALRTDEGIHVSVAEVGPRSGATPTSAWKLRTIEARVTADEVDARASLIVDVSVVGLAREEAVGVIVHGRQLRGPVDITISLEASPAVRALQDRASRLRDRILERLR